LQYFSNEFEKRDIDIEIIAVSDKNINFNKLTFDEENSIPGLDVVNIMNKPAKIFTPFNPDIPYELAKKVDSSKKGWSLLGILISKKKISLPILINKIILTLLEFPLDFSNASIADELQTLFIEIGMLLGLIYIKFPDYFLENIFTDLEVKSKSPLTEFVQYGFQLKKQNKPFIRTNITKKLVEYKSQQNSFQDANLELQTKGTSLGEEAISFWNGIVCYIPNSSFLSKNKIYSIDNQGNIFFALSSNEQAIRQGLRSFFGEKAGFKDSINSPSVILGVATHILLFLLCSPNLSLDDFYITKLRKLARIQCGQKKQEKDKNYSNSFMEEWKAGNLPTTHHSSKISHADLFIDSMINPLGLSQTLWWAVMMMILGEDLFIGQLAVYQETLQNEGIEGKVSALLDYIRKKYSSNVTGNIHFLTYEKKKSVITLDDFPEELEVFESLSHINERGNNCNTRTHYSSEERIELGNKCVWCNKTLLEMEFKLVEPILPNQLINLNPPKFHRQEITKLNSSLSLKNSSYLSSSSLKRVLIVLEGNVGSGKTYFAKLLQEEVEALGGKCLNEGTDKYCVTGISIKEAIKRVSNSLKEINRIKNDLLVVIIDTCGERNTGNNIFNFSFEGWTIHRIRPNFEATKIKQYLSWSLYNVLSRPLHNPKSNFWLNPESATVEICKKVHTDKGKALFGPNFIEVSHKNNLYDIMSDIKIEALEYKEYLKNNLPIEICVKNLMNIIISV